MKFLRRVCQRSLVSLCVFLSLAPTSIRIWAQDTSANVAYVNPNPASSGMALEENPPLVQDTPPLSAPAVQPVESHQEDLALRMKFFTAIANNDKPTLVSMLNAGVDPNMELPFPAPEDFQQRFTDPQLRYYVSGEKGLTGLMLATSQGNHTFVKFLLQAGADPLKMTKRHKTYALWLASRYKHIDIMRTLMGITEEHDSNRFRITIDLSRQEAVLWHDGKIEFETPISSGRKSHPTPKGRFLVTDKYRMWKSTLYDAKMPFFMRLSCGDFGLHVGVLPGHPASHGCIRLPEKSAKKLFASVPVGTLVEIE